MSRPRAKPSLRFLWLALASALPAGALLVDDRALTVLLGYDALLAVALAAAWVSRVRGDPIEARRVLPRVIEARSDAELRLVLVNRGGRALEVELADEIPPELEVLEAPERVRLEAHGTETVVFRVRAVRRGVLSFGDLWLRVRAWPGLVDVDLRVPLEDGLRVHPASLPASGKALALGRASALGPGAARARFLSEGALFEGLRSYVEGDDPRLIEWKATARRGRPVVREMRPERNQRVVLVLDQGRALASAVGEETKLDRAVEAAHQLATLGLAAGDEVGLVGFGATLRARVPASRGPMQGRRILDALVGLEAEPVEADYGRGFAALAAMLGRRALVVVFTDVIDPDSSSTLIRHLSSLLPRHLPLVVTVEDSALASVASGERDDGSVDGLYRKIAARELVEDQRRALETLKLGGVLSVHVPARMLAAATLDRYLELKYRGSL